MDLDVGRLKIILPIDREIPRCPALKLELQTDAKHSSPADQRTRLEERRRLSFSNHTFTFSVTDLSLSMGTPVQVKIDQNLKNLSKSSFALDNEEHILHWEVRSGEERRGAKRVHCTTMSAADAFVRNVVSCQLRRHF